MRRQDFQFDLPDELIASFPTQRRSASRLLHLPKQQALQDCQFVDLPKLLKAGDLLVLNDSKVVPARVYGKKDTGGKIEVLLERVLSERSALVKIKASKSPRQSSYIVLRGEEGSQSVEESVQIVGRQGDLYILQFENDALKFFLNYGEVPLPPYLERAPEPLDDERYQTIYAKDLGSVAAPTAGLHFDEATFTQLKQRGVAWDFVTLHVASGTYQPVRTDDIAEHKMHAESVEVSEALVNKIRATKANGGRVIAVGTTSLRCLEAASHSGQLEPLHGMTDIFIYPGYRFKTIDMLLTNFHLPESTLLMLVSALAGRERILAAYEHAVAKAYRFFSYGDCMLIDYDESQVDQVIK